MDEGMKHSAVQNKELNMSDKSGDLGLKARTEDNLTYLTPGGVSSESKKLMSDGNFVDYNSLDDIYKGK